MSPSENIREYTIYLDKLSRKWNSKMTITKSLLDTKIEILVLCHIWKYIRTQGVFRLSFPTGWVRCLNANTFSSWYYHFSYSITVWFLKEDENFASLKMKPKSFWIWFGPQDILLRNRRVGKFQQIEHSHTSMAVWNGSSGIAHIIWKEKILCTVEFRMFIYEITNRKCFCIGAWLLLSLQ